MNALARLALTHSRAVVISASLLFVLAGTIGATALGDLRSFDSDDPSSESAAARNQLERRSGVDPYFDVVALVSTPHGARSADGRTKIRKVVATIAADPETARVSTPFDQNGAALVARDGHSALVVGGLRPVDEKRQLEASRRLEQRLDGQATVGGVATFFAQGNDIAIEDLTRVEMIAFPILFLLLLWVFRGAVAALLPLLIGGLAIVGTLFVLRIVSEFTHVSIYALNISSALGLGLAIDYSLLIVSRYREELRKDAERALERTLASAGRTVTFSALTVAGALAALLVFPQNFLYSIGLAGMVVAIVAALGALVVLPALLSLLGSRVNSLAPASLQRAAARDTQALEAGFWYRLSRAVMRYPGTIAVVAGALLLLLALPALKLVPSEINQISGPNGSSAKTVRDAVERDFAADVASPVYLVAPAATGRQVIERLATGLGQLPGARLAGPPLKLVGGGWRLDLLLRGDPASSASQELVESARERAPPGVLVGGSTAALVDLKASLARHIPAALAIVVLVTLLAIFLMTGSVLIPLKAVLMNLLTIAACFGVVVFVFQDGRWENLFAYNGIDALESCQMIMLFALAFGLSTDYGVFLIGRIKEARDAGAGNSQAVAVGLERTGRIITAAALLMCVAIGSLVAARHNAVKEIGFGAAVAVALDASLVRALLVPALMQLLGRWNWWAPRPLRILHRRVGLSESR